MAHWCFQLLCILKTRMSWKNRCAFCFSFQLKLCFIQQEIVFERLGSFRFWERWLQSLFLATGMVIASLLWTVAAPLQSHPLSIVSAFLSPHYPPALLITTNHHCHILVRVFWSHLTLRTSSLFLILTKINLLFSHWILLRVLWFTHTVALTQAMSPVGRPLQRLWANVETMALRNW